MTRMSDSAKTTSAGANGNGAVPNGRDAAANGNRNTPTWTPSRPPNGSRRSMRSSPTMAQIARGTC